MKVLKILALMISLCVFSQVSYAQEKSQKNLEQEWITYVKEYEGYRISLKFPQKPILKCLKDGLMLHTTVDGIEYSLCIEDKTEKELDKILSILTSDSIQITHYENYSSQDHEITDVAYEQDKQNISVKIVEFSKFYLIVQCKGGIQKKSLHKKFFRNLDYFQC